MSNFTVATAEAQKGFYPTPPALATKLLEGLKMSHELSILEPSAGTGNLIFALAPLIRKYYYSRSCYGNMRVDVDCCEIDPALQGILQDSFSKKAKEACEESMKAVLEAEGCDKYNTRGLSDDTREVYEHLQDMETLFEKTRVRLVHNDFLTLETQHHYDAIIMNPPFANGDAHLMKAIQMQKRSGGAIRCILNAETIRNPYTHQRMQLVQWLQELDAEIEFVEGAFLDAERATDVEVAIIKIDIPKPELLSGIFEKCKKTEMEKEPAPEDPTGLVIPDIVKQFVSLYNVEVNAGCELIREYLALKPYILTSAIKSSYNKPILQMSVGSDHADDTPSVNEYIRCVRHKYWAVLFQRKEFTGQLTKNLQEMLNDKVREMVNYEFSEYNIRQIMLELNCAMQQGVVETILELFETLTVKHTYSEEFGKNIHYFNGWRTNKAWMVGKKVIIPGYLYADSWSHDTLNTYRAYSLLSDIEKVLNYLDGHMTAEVGLSGALDRANREGRTRNIQCKYFDMTCYKKGTVHLTFTCPELIDRLNIFCARQRNWLPPTYGRTAYANLDAEEKAVVDSFHGDGTEGSGEQAYAAVMARPDYFLAPPNNETLMLNSSADMED